MANVLIEESTLTAIANSIRTKTGNTEKMLPSDMPAQIEGITGGGSGDSSDILKYVTFMSEDGTTELFKMPVISGDDCKNPISHGDIETPTKESTNTQNFDYSGWSAESGGNADASILENITEDKVVYASFIASVRYYTVNFYDDDNVTLLYTTQVTYGADVRNAFTPEKDGYRLAEWLPSVANITEDTNTYAVWVESLRLSDASWETIAEKSADGTASQLWKVGDEKIITLKDGSQVPVMIVGFNHDNLADGSGKAGITFSLKNGVKKSIFSGGSFGWGESYTPEVYLPRYNVKLFMNEYFPEKLINVIKPVKKKWNSIKDSFTTKETNDDLVWLFSETELGYTQTGMKYSGEGEVYEMFSSGKNIGEYEELIRYDLDGNAIEWWLRTCVSNTSGGYYPDYISTKGKARTQSYGNYLYLITGFCI